MNDQVKTLVSDAVRLLLPDLPSGTSPLTERALGALTPYVMAALEEEGHSTAPSAAARDGRTKPWLVTTRFWIDTPNGPEIVAETDPTILFSTGDVPDYLAGLALEMHDGIAPPEMFPESLRDYLPQLRNNLGRYGSAAYRVRYRHDGEDYLCQADVVRVQE